MDTKNWNSTGFKGVTRNRNGFSAALYINGQRVHLGTAPTAEEAFAIYMDAMKLLGPLGYGNPTKHNATGMKGVIAKGNRYEARIWSGDKLHHLGSFTTAEAANAAYNAAAKLRRSAGLGRENGVAA